ncbi:MAG: thioredoxin family protein [Bacteroidota bacterium]
MAKLFFIDERPHNGLTFQKYFEDSEDYVASTNPEILDDESSKLYEFSKLNLQRTKRIIKTYNVSDEMAEIISGIKSEQIWMVLTEDWCGDSAQNLPFIAKIAEINPSIKLRILKRDENLDIIDQYLTNGKSRSIPKLVAFDADGNELFQWGPRPTLLQQKVDEWKTELSKDELSTKIHTFYAANKGMELEKEFRMLLSENTQ